MFTKLDQILGSTVALAVTNVDVTISTAQFQNLRFDVTGVLTGAVSIILPDARGGFFYINNAATGAFTLSLKTANAGTNTIVLPAGGIWVLTNGITVSMVEFPGDVLALASAATTDLGLIRTRRPSITGAAVITAFGSSASISQPLYLVTFTGAATLTHNAVTLILPGARNIITAPGDFLIALYLGGGNWRVLAYIPASGIAVFPNIVGGYRALKVLVASASTVTTTADAISLEDTNGYSFRALAVNVTADITASGANGLDTGAEAASTWYNKWVIYNPTTLTVAGLLSLSATAPTMPAGYTFKMRVGAVRNDVGLNLLRSVQYGRTANYIFGTLPAAPSAVSTQMISGVQGNTGTPTFVAVAVGAFVPPTASTIRVRLLTSGNTIAFVAPNNTAAWGTDLTLDGPYIAVPHNVAGSSNGDIVLESTNIYYTANAAGTNLVALGWEENL